MSFIALNIPPGVLKTRSPEGGHGRWNDALNVRFVAGKPCKKKGYERVNATTMLGKARGMKAWNKISGGDLYAVGTNIRLYGSTDGADVIDITPLRPLQTWTNVLATTQNLGGVKVTMAAHGLSLGKQFVIWGNSFEGGSLVGGIAINGIWELVSVIDANTFEIYPIAAEGTLGTNPFTTTNTSAVVTVAHTAHGRKTGDTVWYAGATAVGGVTPAGDYQITVLNANSYTITHSAAATSGATGGGAAVTYKYGLPASATVATSGGTIPYSTYLTNPFTTTNGSAVVTVVQTAHGAIANDYVSISGSAAVGGITPAGLYPVTVIDANTYTITHSAPATSGATGGGTAILADFEISPGPADKLTSHRGFGQGPLGAGPFGTSTLSSALYSDPRTWAIDTNGEDAIACPLGGTIYYWDSSVGGRADAISGAPGTLRYAFMTDERHLHALGVNGDPMVIGWASQDVLNDWVPTDLNTANNSRRVREGSLLMAGTPYGGGLNLIWTDTAVYRHLYTGSQFIYDTDLDQPEAGLIAAQAFARTPKGILWMGATRFKMFNGSTADIPNASDIETFVYENLDRDQQTKCFAHYDAINNCVDFYYVPLGGSEPSAVVTVCLDDWSWTNDTQTRSTGATPQRGSKNPYRVLDGVVYRHEVGLDADGASAPSSLTMAPYEIANLFRVRNRLAPQTNADIYGFDPDFLRQVGDVNINIQTYERVFPNVQDNETEVAHIGDEIVDFRCDGRHFDLTISQNLLGGDWAMDSPQLGVMPRGDKR